MLTINALAATDRIINPVSAQYLSAKGVEQLLDTVARVKRSIDHKLKIDGVLLTMVDSRTNTSKEIAALLRSTYGSKIKVFDSEIPRSVRAAEISAEDKSIFEHDPGGKAAAAYGEIIMVAKEKRLIQHNFKTTEAEIIRKKMKSLGVTNASAYLRSMVLGGYILKLDLPQIREMIRLLSNMTNNFNQIAKCMNAHGQIYETEIDEIMQKQDDLWQMMKRLLTILERTA